MENEDHYETEGDEYWEALAEEHEDIQYGMAVMER